MRTLKSDGCAGNMECFGTLHSSHSSSQLSVQTSLTGPDCQSAWALVRHCFGELLASCRNDLSGLPAQVQRHLSLRKVAVVHSCQRMSLEHRS